jgi:hypothetical protein
MLGETPLRDRRKTGVQEMLLLHNALVLRTHTRRTIPSGQERHTGKHHHHRQHIENVSPIKQEQCGMARRTLGVQLCPNSDSTSEVTKITETGKDIAKAINSISQTPTKAACFQCSISHPRMAHSLPVTHMDKEQLNSAQSAATFAILPPLMPPVRSALRHSMEQIR